MDLSSPLDLELFRYLGLMKIRVQVKPQRRVNLVEQLADGLLVQLRAPAAEGKANAALVCVLAEHYGVRKSDVTIVNGHSSRIKMVEIAKDPD